jgi:hypothetical protein
VGDAGYLLFPVDAGAAVLLLSVSDSGQSRKRLLLDGVIVAASMFLISWVTVLDSVFRTGSDTSLAFAVSLAYPVADMAIITIGWARLVAAYRPTRNGPETPLARCGICRYRVRTRLCSSKPNDK